MQRLLLVQGRQQHAKLCLFATTQYVYFHKSHKLNSTAAATELGKFATQLQAVLEYNSNGQVVEAVNAYEDLKKNHLHELDLPHYNQIIASFAPRKLMFKWFQPYKDFVDMYYEAGNFRSQERMDEARLVFEDIEKSPLQLRPDLQTWNALIKVQLSAGLSNVVQVFDTFNQITKQQQQQPNMTSLSSLLRACSLLERDDVAEELYVHTLHTTALKKKQHLSKNDISIHIFNAMLDVYAESRNDFAFIFFQDMLQKKLPVNGATFNAYAKACIFMDQRERLVAVPELMRVEGVLQVELSEPVRKEIHDAYQRFNVKMYKTSPAYQFYKQRSNLTEMQPYNDPMAELRMFPTWGRRIDQADYKFMKLLKPYVDQYQVDLEKILEPKLGDTKQ